jgi:hypothetical protein
MTGIKLYQAPMWLTMDAHCVGVSGNVVNG